MSPVRPAWPAALVLAAAPAWAWADGLGGGTQLGLVQRELQERDNLGRRLVRERGTLLSLALDARLDATWARASLAAGRLAYTGQTQGGVPLASHADHTEAALAAGGRTIGPAGAQLELGLGLRWLRRDIAGAPGVGGLVETSRVTLLQAGWAQPLGQWAGGSWQAALDAGVGLRERLDMDFGTVFDAATLRGGHWRELGLALRGQSGRARIELRWLGMRQAASPAAALYRGGVPAGAVHQPRLSLDDWRLGAALDF